MDTLDRLLTVEDLADYSRYRSPLSTPGDTDAKAQAASASADTSASDGAMS